MVVTNYINRSHEKLFRIVHSNSGDFSRPWTADCRLVSAVRCETVRGHHVLDRVRHDVKARGVPGRAPEATRREYGEEEEDGGCEPCVAHGDPGNNTSHGADRGSISSKVQFGSAALSDQSG